MQFAIRFALIAAILVTSSASYAQGRAYRSLAFGDSFDVVANKIFEDDAFQNGFRPVSESLGMAKSPREWLSWGMSVDTVIGGERYGVEFKFYDDKLYRVVFTGRGHTADYFDTTVRSLRNSLVEVIGGAHGPPTLTRDPGLLDMAAGHVTWSHIWDTNEEGVAYFIGIGRSGFRYFPVLSVEWTWMSDLVDGLGSQAADEEIRQSQDDF